MDEPFQVKDKILPLADLSQVRERHKEQTIVLCHGTFDLVHPGHIAHLEEARALGDVLVVTLTADDYVTKKRRCMFTEDVRQHTIASLEIVDYVSLVDDGSALPVLEILKPDLYIKGNEYEKFHLDASANISREKEAVEKNGGILYFTKKEPMSSTKIGYFFNVSSEGNNQQIPGDKGSLYKDLSHLGWKFIDYKEFAYRSIELDVVIVGETIVDKTVQVTREGISPKSKCVTGEYINQDSYVGGAAAVALHLSPFVRSVHLVTNACADMDEWRHMLESVQCIAPQEIVKTRFCDEATGVQLFELKNTKIVRCDSLQQLPKADILLMVDFGHGLCDQDIRQRIHEMCQPNFTGIMAQTNSSNYGFNSPSKYKEADYFSLNTLEAQLLQGRPNNDPARLAASLSGYLDYKYASVTAGSAGAYIISSKEDPELVEAACSRVSDTVGCGDAYFAFSSLALATGSAPAFAAMLGNLGGALVGQKKYSYPPITVSEMTNLAKIVF